MSTCPFINSNVHSAGRGRGRGRGRSEDEDEGEDEDEDEAATPSRIMCNDSSFKPRCSLHSGGGLLTMQLAVDRRRVRSECGVCVIRWALQVLRMGLVRSPY